MEVKTSESAEGGNLGVESMQLVVAQVKFLNACQLGNAIGELSDTIHADIQQSQSRHTAQVAWDCGEAVALNVQAFQFWQGQDLYSRSDTVRECRNFGHPLVKVDHSNHFQDKLLRHAKKGIPRDPRPIGTRYVATGTTDADWVEDEPARPRPGEPCLLLAAPT